VWIATFQVECVCRLRIVQSAAAASGEPLEIGVFARFDGSEKRVVSDRTNFTELVLLQAFREARDSIWKGVLVAVRYHGCDRSLTLGKCGLFSQLEC
jgi:hypothetical protein